MRASLRFVGGRGIEPRCGLWEKKIKLTTRGTPYPRLPPTVAFLPQQTLGDCFINLNY